MCGPVRGSAGRLWSGTKAAPPASSAASSRRSVATQRSPAAGISTDIARPEPASETSQSRHSGRGGASTSEQRRSCSSSALRSSGRACSVTLATTSGSSAARSRASRGRPRRVVTARVRRSSRGASSRNVYGRPFKISSASTEGITVSTQCAWISPDRTLEHARQALEVHRLGTAVVERLAHDRVIRDLDRAGHVLLAGGERRKDGGHQVVGFHTLDWGRHPPAPPVPGRDERTRRDSTSIGRRRSASGAPLGSRCPSPSPGTSSRAPPPRETSAGDRARGRPHRRSPPPAARSRRSGRNASGAPAPARG